MIDLRFRSYATCSGEHQRRERGLFHLHKSACVHTFLLVFILAIYVLRGKVLVRFCIWVAHPYVKEYGTLSMTLYNEAPPPPHLQPPFTNYCMIDIKGFFTDTYIWYVTYLPVMPYMDCIFKLSLVGI